MLRNDFSIRKIQYAPFNFAEYGKTSIKLARYDYVTIPDQNETNSRSFVVQETSGRWESFAAYKRPQAIQVNTRYEIHAHMIKYLTAAGKCINFSI